MSEPILYIDTSEIREGKLEEVKAAFAELVDFVDANEPRAIAYQVYVDERENRVSVVQIHPDSASLEVHMQVAGPAFSGFTDLLELSTIEIYGKPSETLLERLRQKARMLGKGSVVVHDLHAGFSRLG